MKNYNLFTCLLAFMLLGISTANAQEERTSGIAWASFRGLEYEVKAGLSIGGTSPLPLPEEIRSIDSYKPNIAISIEGNATKWFGDAKKWGMLLGLRLENKTMTTEATVKNYSMEIVGDGGEKVSGVWTGGVKTKVTNSYLAIPILAKYQLTKRWNLQFGAYLSYLIEGDFSGNVYEGYLRKTDPTGPKVEFSDGKTATYDFSNDLRNFQWGGQFGAEWKAFKHLNVYADLTWGFNNMFKKDFKTISFAMYPIYMNMGFGYAF